ncbi:hypothetical protein CR970_00300 [Candidatus Saccharibacteria bacterium]|nr:MAG: hypothetical protein CR970_00300 [Candidatus Saccharibacteria bacterium]
MNIDEIVKGYHPNEKLIDLIGQIDVVLLCGITGAGKDTILKRILAKDANITRIVTSTTRPPRDNDGVMERDGVDYYFFSKQQAAEKIAKGEYFEVANVHNNINGVTADEIRRIHNANKIALADIDYQGVEYFYSYHPGVKAIFVVPPSYEVWRERMERRHDDKKTSLSELPVRKASALRELEWALGADFCHFVVNDDLDTAIERVYRIINNQSGHEEAARQIVKQLLEKMR